MQRMPRCRRGYIHVVNNDFTEWQMYAIGGSASPTINSQGNRYMAPADPNAKEVTSNNYRSQSISHDLKGKLSKLKMKMYDASYMMKLFDLFVLTWKLR